MVFGKSRGVKFPRESGKKEFIPFTPKVWNTPSGGTPIRPSESRFTQIAEEAWSNTGGVTSLGSRTVQTFSRVYSGTRTPNYGKLKKASRLPVNPYTLNVWHQDVGRWLLTMEKSGSWSGQEYEIRSMTLDHALPAGPSALPEASDKALKKLMSKISGGGNLALDFLEYGQFLNMVGTTMTRITGSVKQLKKGNIPGAVSTLWGPTNPRFKGGRQPSKKHSLAQNWLEMQYGWKPLLDDIHGASVALARKNLDNVDVQRAIGKGGHQSEVVTPVSGIRTAGIISGSPTVGKTTVGTETIASYGVRYKVASQLTAFLAQTGFTNPINLAWEILPFSFVVDWFLPIGPFLESLSAFHGLDFVDGYHTTFTRQRTSMTVSGSYTTAGTPGFNRIWTEKGLWEREWISISRVKLTAFPGARFPQLKNPLSTYHILNSLALMKVLFGKR